MQQIKIEQTNGKKLYVKKGTHLAYVNLGASEVGGENTAASLVI